MVTVEEIVDLIDLLCIEVKIERRVSISQVFGQASYKFELKYKDHSSKILTLKTYFREIPTQETSVDLKPIMHQLEAWGYYCHRQDENTLLFQRVA